MKNLFSPLFTNVFTEKFQVSDLSSKDLVKTIVWIHKCKPRHPVGKTIQTQFRRIDFEVFFTWTEPGCIFGTEEEDSLTWSSQPG